MTLSVNLGDLRYEILVERGCLSRAAEHFDLCRRVLIVTDAGVPLFVHTVNDAAEQQRLYDLGVTCIYTAYAH